MAIAGAGAGINELTALAVASELAPTRKRGTYVAVLVFTIVPFCPSVLWAQLIAAHAGWRYCGVLCGVWAAVGLLLTIFFYFPPPRVNSQGLSRMEVFKQIDFVGGFLSIFGMLLFMAGLQWGGYQVGCPRSPENRKRRFLRRSLVFLENRPRPCPPVPGLLPTRGLWHLGSQIRQISHVPGTPEAESSHSRVDPSNHLHIRSQLLLRPPLLANTSV